MIFYTFDLNSALVSYPLVIPKDLFYIINNYTIGSRNHWKNTFNKCLQDINKKIGYTCFGDKHYLVGQEYQGSYQFFYKLKDCYNHWIYDGKESGYEKIEILGEVGEVYLQVYNNINMCTTTKLRILERFTPEEARELVNRKRQALWV